MSQKTVCVAYSANDAVLGQKLTADLKAAGYNIVTQVANESDALLVLVRPSAIKTDSTLNQMMLTALDNGQHVLPITVDDQPLPRIIGNLQPLNFAGNSYPLKELKERVAYLLSPQAPAPLTVLTPKVRARNRRIGLLIGIPTLIIFVAGVVLVGTGLIRPPSEEYILVETQRVETRNAIINPTLEAVLPRSTDDALNFAPTVQAMPTRLRPFLEATATARSEE